MEDYNRGFNPGRILNGDEYNKSLEQLRPIQSNSMLDSDRLTQNATEQTYAQNKLLEQQSALNLQNTNNQTDQLQQQALARSSQQGIGAGPLSAFNNQSMEQDIARTKEFQREAHTSMVGAERALNIENSKTRLAQKGIQQMQQQFQQQMQNFNKEFSKYQKTSISKFGQERRQAQERQQRRSEQAWSKLSLGLESSNKAGSILGGIVGGIGGGIAFATTGNAGFLSSGINLGKGIGGGIGTGIGNRNAQQQIASY